MSDSRAGRHGAETPDALLRRSTDRQPQPHEVRLEARALLPISKITPAWVRFTVLVVLLVLLASFHSPNWSTHEPEWFGIAAVAAAWITGPVLFFPISNWVLIPDAVGNARLRHIDSTVAVAGGALWAFMLGSEYVPWAVAFGILVLAVLSRLLLFRPRASLSGGFAPYVGLVIIGPVIAVPAFLLGYAMPDHEASVVVAPFVFALSGIIKMGTVRVYYLSRIGLPERGFRLLWVPFASGVFIAYFIVGVVVSASVILIPSDTASHELAIAACLWLGVCVGCDIRRHYQRMTIMNIAEDTTREAVTAVLTHEVDPEDCKRGLVVSFSRLVGMSMPSMVAFGFLSDREKNTIGTDGLFDAGAPVTITITKPLESFQRTDAVVLDTSRMPSIFGEFARVYAPANLRPLGFPYEFFSRLERTLAQGINSVNATAARPSSVPLSYALGANGLPPSDSADVLFGRLYRISERNGSGVSVIRVSLFDSVVGNVERDDESMRELQQCTQMIARRIPGMQELLPHPVETVIEAPGRVLFMIANVDEPSHSLLTEAVIAYLDSLNLVLMTEANVVPLTARVGSVFSPRDGLTYSVLRDATRANVASRQRYAGDPWLSLMIAVDDAEEANRPTVVWVQDWMLSVGAKGSATLLSILESINASGTSNLQNLVIVPVDYPVMVDTAAIQQLSDWGVQFGIPLAQWSEQHPLSLWARYIAADSHVERRPSWNAMSSVIESMGREVIWVK